MCLNKQAVVSNCITLTYQLLVRPSNASSWNEVIIPTVSKITYINAQSRKPVLDVSRTLLASKVERVPKHNEKLDKFAPILPDGDIKYTCRSPLFTEFNVIIAWTCSKYLTSFCVSPA